MKNGPFHFRILLMMITIVCSLALPDDAMGQPCPLCSGSQNIEIGNGSASGFQSYAFGLATSAGDYGFSIGSKVFAQGKKSFVIGYKAEAASTDTLNYVFGCGTEDDNLLNDVDNSIMFGTNSNLSTVFVGGANGYGTWGNVGIGSITSPASLLHVRDDMRLGLTGSASGTLIFNNSAGNTISFNTPDSMSNQSYTLPVATGSTNDFLQLGTGGQLQWASAGSVTGAWMLTGNAGTIATTNFLGTTDSVDLVLRTNNLERVRVKAGGNVGIGTGSPASLLHLVTSADTELRIEKGTSNTGSLRFVSGTSVATLSQTAASDVELRNHKSNTDQIFLINKGGTNTEVMRIEGSTARVGIGTSDPITKLHVSHQVSGSELIASYTVGDAGDDRVRFSNLSTVDSTFAPMVQGYSTTQNDLPALTMEALTDTAMDHGDQPVMQYSVRRDDNSKVVNRPLIRWKNGSQSLMQMNVAADNANRGNLGIGTTSPSGRLHVNGTVFINYGSVPPSTVIGGGGNDQDLGINSSNGQLINLSTSSIHYKENVEDIEFDHEAFLNLRAVDFKWKEYFGGGNDVGMIAQEVAEDFPALASWSHKYTHLPDGSLLMDSTGVPVVDETQFEVSGVRYHKLPVYLFSIVKELHSRMEQLEQQVQELTARLDGCCTVVEPMNKMDGGGDSGNGSFSEFVLLRNDPNPFSDYTDVQYEHDGCTDCQIIITDVTGRIIKRILTEGTKGTVRVYSSEIGSGMFIYSLVKDGNTVRSERMISSNR